MDDAKLSKRYNFYVTNITLVLERYLTCFVRAAKC